MLAWRRKRSAALQAFWNYVSGSGQGGKYPARHQSQLSLLSQIPQLTSIPFPCTFLAFLTTNSSHNRQRALALLFRLSATLATFNFVLATRPHGSLRAYLPQPVWCWQ